jgi:hypothetical protein
VGKLLVAAQDRERATEIDTKGLVLRVKGDMIEAVPVDGNFPRGGKLQLVLSSGDPTKAARTVRLSPSELGWRGVGSLNGEDGLVELRPESGTWMLRGRWTSQVRSVRLVP